MDGSDPNPLRPSWEPLLSSVVAGGVDRTDIDRSAGFSDDDRAHLVARGIAITNLVNRATVRASELTSDELREGGERLGALVAELRPRVVAVAGITAYRIAFRRPKAQLGRQPEDLAGAELWAVPNPSGLNAHETTATLAQWYHRVGVAAGIV